jgi:hypothetical protein
MLTGDDIHVGVNLCFEDRRAATQQHNNGLCLLAMTSVGASSGRLWGR